ncbi:aliphatic sulfonate ABC transporter substrate-binding protein [Sporosarcina beigongshangi]|uniref:aliphatic sulfonate ABC transporter substrate-binding protein n=1 Tax=Sporosarcina beigongshangi TaxID=2782538 RepID=UPI00193A1D0C|nr:aliphatic sulfonate ABC transporter substrate-binding protein [Sporosarcina beigongshangi]
MKRKLIVLAIISLVVLSIGTACGKGVQGAVGSKEVNIGYFPNLTHITTIVALEKGYFAEAFGEDIKINTKTVSSGGLFMEAMVTKSIDVGTVGPGPLLNFYVKDPSYHIISGAVNGGAVLVASEHSNITDLVELDGKKVAIPGIGNTQDIMLRKALNDVGLKPTSNGGTVQLFATAPADTTTLFIQKSVDVAAIPEPWGYILESQANGRVLLDWESFAWGKETTNTVVAATKNFLENEQFVTAYLTAHTKAVDFIKQKPVESQELVIRHIKDLTGKEINKEEIQVAFSRLEVTTSVNEQVIQEMADISKEAGYVRSNDIDGLIQLDQLKEIEGK